MRPFRRHGMRNVCSMLLCIACGPSPVSKTVLDAQLERQAIEGEEARSDAPQLVALGNRWLRAAESDTDDQKSATLKAEVALATYERARIQARSVAARQRLANATDELAKLAGRLESLRAEQQLLEQAAEAIEVKVKILQDAEPLGPVHAASPKREAARRASARVFAERARLLCLAAKLLDPKKEPATGDSTSGPKERPADAMLAQLDALESELDKAPQPTPIDRAIALRSECLSEFTALRRAQSAPASQASDQLFQGLSVTFKENPPYRDERGVILELPEAFDSRGALLPSIVSSLEKARAIVANNPAVRLVVLARSTRASEGTLEKNVQSLRNTLTPEGGIPPLIHATRRRLHSPVRAVKGLKSKTDRLELAFLFASP